MGKPKKYIGETWSNPFDHGGKDYRWDNEKKEYVVSHGESPFSSIKRSWGERIVPAAQQYAERQKRLTKESLEKYKPKEETLVKEVLDKRINVSDTSFYPEALFGQEVDFTFNAENDISQYYNWRESVDPQSDFGQYVGDLTEHNTFKDNAAFNIIKTNGGENTHTKVTWKSSFAEKVKNQKSKEQLGEIKPPVPEPIVDETELPEDKYRDVTIEGGKETSNTIGTIGDKAWTQDTDPNREGYIGGKKQSPIQDKLLEAGFQKDELSELMEKYADRPRPNLFMMINQAFRRGGT